MKRTIKTNFGDTQPASDAEFRPMDDLSSATEASSRDPQASQDSSSTMPSAKSAANSNSAHSEPNHQEANTKPQAGSLDESESSAKINSLLADLQRTRADFENYRKQAEIQKQHHAEIIELATVKKILPILDDLDRAVAAHPEQLGPIAKNITKTANSLGLRKLDVSSGTEFNPDFHEAVAMEGEGDLELVSEVLLPGYQYKEHILRPAMVKVAKQS